jgi:hypothetical protein
MKAIVRFFQWTFVVVVVMTIVMCGSSNRFMEYEFNNRTAAAMMALPPPPEVFTDSWFMIDDDNLVEAAIKIGTTIAKEVEVQKTRDKLSLAMEEVDVPERIRERTLERCGKYLRYQPVDDNDDADFLFDIQIEHYGIDAKSWSASVHFKIDVNVYLIDNKQGIEVWKKHVKEQMPVSRSIFGLPDEAGDIITAVSLSELSVDEMVMGFDQLAGYTADQIARKLQRDFSEARSKRE